jgi:hypothetical protein
MVENLNYKEDEMKLFKNLAVWWGWMFYKQEILSVIIVMLITSAGLILSAYVVNSPNSTIICVGITFGIMLALILTGSYFDEISRNWRVAVAEAEKITGEAWEQKDQRTLDVLGKYTGQAKADRSGKDLARLIQLLRKYNELSARLESFEQERNELDIKHDRVLNERIHVSAHLKRDYFS